MAQTAFTAPIWEPGLRLLVRENPSSETAVLRGRAAAGAAYEGERPDGLAEMTARLLLSGTRQRSKRELGDALNRLGAAITFQNNLEYVEFLARAPRDGLSQVLQILAEVLREPTFPDAEVTRVRGEVLASIRRRDDHPLTRARRELLRLLYAGHPFGRDAAGDGEGLDQVDSSMIRAFHAEKYRRGALCLAVSGAVSAEDAARLVRSHLLDSFEGDHTRPQGAPANAPSRARQQIEMAHKSQTDIAYGAIVVPRTHRDYEALDLAVRVLGGVPFSGRLGQRIRDELGLAYYSGASVEAFQLAGHWAIRIGVNPRNLARAEQEMQQIVAAYLDKGAKTEELSLVQAFTLGRLQLAWETNEAAAELMQDIAYYDLGLDYPSQYAARVRATTTDDLAEAARRYLQPNRCALVEVGPMPM